MWAHIEYFDGGLIRVFKDKQKYLDPYTYVMPFKIIETDPQVFEFKGILKAPSQEELRAIINELRSRKIRVLRTRIINGIVQIKEFS